MMYKIRATFALPLLALLVACSSQPGEQPRKVMMGVVVAITDNMEVESQAVLIRTDSGDLVVQDMAPGLEPGDRVFVKRAALTVGARA